MPNKEILAYSERLNPQLIAAHLQSTVEKRRAVESIDPDTGAVIKLENWDILLYSELTRRTTVIKVFPQVSRIGISVKNDKEFIAQLPEPMIEGNQQDSTFHAVADVYPITAVEYITLPNRTSSVRFIQKTSETLDTVLVSMKGSVSIRLGV